MNEAAKAKLGIDNAYHVFVSNFDGERTASVRTVVSAESVAALTKIAAALEMNRPSKRTSRMYTAFANSAPASAKPSASTA